MANANNKSDKNASPLNSFTQRRGPNKRKVKVPDQPQIFQFNMPESDSEEDEDFVAFSEEGSSDESGDCDVIRQDGGSSSGSEDDDNAPGTQSPQMVDDPATSLPTTVKSPEKEEGSELEECLAKENGLISDITLPKAAKEMAVLVCGICLESESTEEDELVECDNCGITVHEGCYGDTEESISESKSDSDAATEPWFCDACKAQANCICELCPNKGGILKQTDTGKWVHLICALYVPGAGFRDVDRLQMIVLEDINSSRWGARRCMLCEDQRFSRTGVCIGCDAGLCRSYFHAMCAQKHGLLIEIPDAGHLNDDAVDPLFAHCKMHTEKHVMRNRKNSWLSFQAHVKNFKLSEDPEEKSRIEASYKRAREEYQAFVNSLPAAKIPTTEKPRLLSTCPEACESLLKKAELLGNSIISDEIHDIEPLHTGNAAKGGFFKPNLSNGFVNHFFKREKWLKENDISHEQLKSSIINNQKEQKTLQEAWDSMKSNSKQLVSEKGILASKILRIHSSLETMIGTKLSEPDVLKPKKKLKKEPEVSLEEFIHTCAKCNKTENQQLMSQCETCYKYYHIYCLDPPLTQLPKKGPKWVWQCTDCDESDSSEESIDLDEPLTKRKKRVKSAPLKFTPVDEEKKTHKRKSVSGTRRGRPRKVKDESSESETATAEKPSESTIASNHTPRQGGRKKLKVIEIFDDCTVCSKEGSSKNMVGCDECLKCYHFQCCNPKLRANPKRRGYSWICTACTESDDEEDDDDVDMADEGEAENKADPDYKDC